MTAASFTMLWWQCIPSDGRGLRMSRPGSPRVTSTLGVPVCQQQPGPSELKDVMHVSQRLRYLWAVRHVCMSPEDVRGKPCSQMYLTPTAGRNHHRCRLPARAVFLIHAGFRQACGRIAPARKETVHVAACYRVIPVTQVPERELVLVQERDTAHMLAISGCVVGRQPFRDALLYAGVLPMA